MNDGLETKVCGFQRRTGRLKHIGYDGTTIMEKLNESKMRWIIREKRRNVLTNRQIASSMGISVRWMQKIWAKYRNTDPAKIMGPGKPGRPENGLTGRMEHSTVLYGHGRYLDGAVRLERKIEADTGTHIPHNTVHRILKDSQLGADSPKKKKRRKWVRYERTYSNSMWHTDYKQLSDGRWFLCYMDDASRFITGFGVFEKADTQNAIKVLHRAIQKHGKPASIMTDHGSQFYANKSEGRKKGSSSYEEELVRLGIRQILAGVGHPQTNGKLERFHGEMEAKLHHLSGVWQRSSGGPLAGAQPTEDLLSFEEDHGVGWFIQKHNEVRPHMSLDDKTPAQAFVDKMPENESRDDQTGQKYVVQKTPDGRTDVWEEED